MSRVQSSFAGSVTSGDGRYAGMAELADATDLKVRGGWRTRSMFSRYSIVDEQDLADAGQAYARFLERAASASRKVERLPVSA